MNTDEIKDLLNRISRESDPDKLYYLRKEAHSIKRPGVKFISDSIGTGDPDFTIACLTALRGVAENQSTMDLEGVILFSFDKIIEQFAAEVPDIRIAAIGALYQVLHGYYVNSQAVDMLNPKLKESVSKGVPKLVEMLTDDEIRVRLKAAHLLHRSGFEELIGEDDQPGASRARRILIEALDHPDAGIRKDAASAFIFDADSTLVEKAGKIRAE